jgi:hypothetical protein
MSVRSFRPVVSVATVAVAALGCYLVSLRVAAERAGLEEVEYSIVLAQRDIRTLQTEIGTRGRLEQLERWNVKVLALSAPKADQFVDGGYQLARLARPSGEIDMTAPVVLAAAPKPSPAQPIRDDDADVAASSAEAGPGPTTASPRATAHNGSAASMMHVASYSPSTDPTAAAPPKISRKLAGTPAITTKPVKIATAARQAPLPSAKHDAKASVTPAKSGTTRDKANH